MKEFDFWNKNYVYVFIAFYILSTPFVQEEEEKHSCEIIPNTSGLFFSWFMWWNSWFNDNNDDEAQFTRLKGAVR